MPNRLKKLILVPEKPPLPVYPIHIRYAVNALFPNVDIPVQHAVRNGRPIDAMLEKYANDTLKHRKTPDKRIELAFLIAKLARQMKKGTPPKTEHVQRTLQLTHEIMSLRDLSMPAASLKPVYQPTA